MSTKDVFEFSVLMPVYAKENPAYIDLALNSILRSQSINPTEIVIVEDGPLTVPLTEVLVKYFKLYPQIIRLIKLDKNQGMGKAMNFGLNQCRYDWIFRMDSDDIAENDRFERQIEVIKRNKYDVIGTATEEFKEVVGDLKQLRVMPEHHEDIIKFMKLRNPINHMTVAFRKNKAIEAGGYWEKRYFEDYNLWYEMFKVGARFYNIQNILVKARIGNNMVGRRSGYAYYQFENELMSKFYKDKFINYFEYKVFLSLKFCLRLLPVSFLSLVYKKFLRKK
ncbi:glycosyltransferase [Mucilaginibacter sp.]|uniref:glycosyltransferase n=1 Tax=Mucilaginibacter sp. TaxID=1882438 RepID=UPI0035BBBFAE